MISATAGKAKPLLETQQVAHKTGSVASRKIWLPKRLYSVLPYFYLASGVAALFATLYIGQWFWVLPHHLVFTAACLHLGIAVYRKRAKAKREVGKDAS